MASCQKEDVEDVKKPDNTISYPTIHHGNKVADITNVAGVVYYNADLGLWFINVHETGTIDNTIIYFPTALSEEYQVEGLQVKFSGTTYEMDSTLLAQIPQLGGGEYYVIEINTIIKLQL